MTTITATVRRIERIDAESVRLTLASDAPIGYGVEHIIIVPVADECPTGTPWTITYAREVAE